MRQHAGTVLTFLLAAGILTACGEARSAAEPRASGAETTTSAAAETTTAVTTMETTAASPQVTVAHDTPVMTQKTELSFVTNPVQPGDTTTSAQAASGADTPGESTLLEALMTRLQTTDDAIHIRYVYDIAEYGASITGEQYSYGDCFLTDVSVGYPVKICSDGSAVWMIHDATKTYAVMTGDNAANMQQTPTADMLPQTDHLEERIGTGTEQFKGMICRYEDYVFDADMGGDKLRYYFDDNGSLRGIRGMTGEEEGIEIEYLCETVASPDLSLFAPPAGYTEISELEMTQQMLAERDAASVLP